jgi:hypothetical protein
LFGSARPYVRRDEVAVLRRPRNPEWFRVDFRVLLELLREGKIHPVVAERLPLSDARRAHGLLESSAATAEPSSAARLGRRVMIGFRGVLSS